MCLHCSMRALQSEHVGLVTPQYVGSQFWTRDQTCFSELEGGFLTAGPLEKSLIGEQFFNPSIKFASIYYKSVNFTAQGIIFYILKRPLFYRGFQTQLKVCRNEFSCTLLIESRKIKYELIQYKFQNKPLPHYFLYTFNATVLP